MGWKVLNIARLSLFILLNLLMLNVVSSYSQVIVQRVSIVVEIDGSTIIHYKLYVPNPPADVSITLPDDPIYYTVYVNNTETPAYYENGRLYFYAIAEDVEIEVLSNGLTRKEGFRWILKVDMKYPFKLILPQNTIILNISTQDFSVSVEEDGRLSLLLPKGNMTIVYTYPPAIEVGESPQENFYAILIPIAIASGLLVIFFLYLLRRRRNPVEVEVLEGELDDRDMMILDVLKGGMKSAQEIMDETGIPKSPLYRRLKKLEDLGYIASIRKSGVKYYYLRRDST